MMLDQIAQTIVDHTSEIIDYPIIITDDKGTIIGSTDRGRLGSLHIASLDVLRKNRTISYAPGDVEALDNVLPGIATPIVLNDAVIGVLGIAGEPDAIKKYVQLVKSHVELMFRESFKKETSALEAKALETMVQYLLLSSPAGESDPMIEYGRMLGYRFDLDRVCIVIEPDLRSLQLPSRDGGADPYAFPYFRQDLVEQVKRLFVDRRQDIFAFFNLDRLVVLKAVQPHEHASLAEKTGQRLRKLNQYLTDKHRIVASAALGSVASGVAGIKQSYENAVRTLKIGKRTPSSLPFYHYNDWEITLELLAQELTPPVADKLAGLLLALREHPNYETLSATFMAYCKCNLNLSETARTLFVHRNSLHYRLDKLSELTGLDLSTFEHSLLLYVALRSARDQ